MLKNIEGSDIFNLIISIYNLYSTYSYGISVIGIIILIVNVVLIASGLKNKKKNSIINMICLAIVFITIIGVIREFV